ncbi:MAG TPA: hemerythrin domain-containing protein [Anaeromyxobacter sp.]|nr:hemerythrin domain-containing protein [Anaeromyxobacter sp.]
MNAIDLLEQQHREVEELFEEFEGAGEGAQKTKERLCREISDQLAIHAELEERLFYPEAKQENTEEILRESVEEHLAMKRILADLMESEPSDEQFDAKMKVLKEQVEHHVEEEEKDLFPKVRKSCSKEELEDLGERMEALAEELEAGGEPSKSIPGQTDSPAEI